MSNLNKFLGIYEDLEKSYESLKSKFNVSERNEFLRILCYSKKGECIIPTIKSLLKSEVPTYTSEQLEDYSGLMDCLNSLDLFLCNNDINNVYIKNLNTFMTKCIYDYTYSTVSERINKESLEGMLFNVIPTYVLSPKRCFNKHGEVSSFCKLFRGKTIKVVVRDDFSDDFITISDYNIMDVLNHLKVDNSDFGIRLKKLIVTLSNKEQFRSLLPLTISSASNYKEGKLLGRAVKEVDGVVKYNGTTIYLI